ncbi:hypothetical protein [uncultured Pseudomonas sp.]|uniref:hypothetical protein n=1 Tax=uncultured Pseudomonas sp. TaxID=114707 RepID=UPI0027D9909B|nr:hypothetical protein [uncultured Pseudomonas sp.]
MNTSAASPALVREPMPVLRAAPEMVAHCARLLRSMPWGGRGPWVPVSTPRALTVRATPLRSAL